MENRNEEAFGDCCEKYMPMISSLIKRWELQGNREEYIQVGRIALYEAWQKFDPKNWHFAVHAISYVYGRTQYDIGRHNRSD